MGLGIGICGPNDNGSGGGGLAILSAELQKTDQTASYRTGDDGDYGYGRDDDFLTLPADNPFGSTFKFTDELGGQTFTNGIAIDWSTSNGTEVLGWRITASAGSQSWDNAIDGALLVSIGTFTTGWFLPNAIQLDSIKNFSTSRYLNYAPFNITGNDKYWSSTTYISATTQAFNLGSQASVGMRSVAKTTASTTYKWIPCRIFTYAELGL